MAIAIVKGIVNVASGATLVVRPPSGEVWAITSVGAHRNDAYAPLMYLGNGSIRTALTVQEETTITNAAYMLNNKSSPLIIDNTLWFELTTNGATAGAGVVAYTGVKL